MSPATPTLQRLSRREVQALNLIAAHGHDIRIDLEPGVVLDLQALAGDEGGLTQGLGAVERFALEWGGARFELAFPRAALTDWFNVRLQALGYSGAEVTTLGSHWRQTARTLALAWLLDGLERSGRGQARLADESSESDSAPQDAPPAPFVFALELGFPGSGDRVATLIPGRMACDSLGLMLIAGLVSALPAASGSLQDAVSALPMKLALQLGSTTLPLSELGSLRTGDIVLVTRMLRDPDGVFHLRLDPTGGSAAFRARLENGALISLDELAAIMPDTPPSTTDPTQDAPVSLEQMPVRLDFDLGELTVTLAELRTLRPGQALALDAPISAAVTIRANGAAIGSGELVEIDGRSGVVIRSLFPPQPVAPKSAQSTKSAEAADDDDDV